MGKDLRGKELGVGISQQKNGLYSARFVDKYGTRRQKRFKKLQECRQWLADAAYIDEHSNLAQANDMMVDAWFAKENDILRYNPCKKSVKSDMGKPSDKKEALTIDVQRMFLEGAAGKSYENQFRFVLQTGLRTGELVGLEWKHVDFEKRVLTIEQSMEYRYKVGEWRIGPPKSKAGYRTIPLTDEAIRILKAQKEKNRKIEHIPEEWSEFIFLSRKGEPVKNSTYDTALFKICDKVGIKRFSMHVLRHTFATRCIEANMKPKTLQKLLGHSSIQITMNLYVHVTEEEKQKEIELVAEALKVI